MRLLNTRTLQLEEHRSVADLRYAILSHVWQEKEQTFQDIEALRGSSDDAAAQVSAKIRECCRVAARDGFEWLWIDTCCIDKTSSAELSEAINSMYAWYASATICYAYLHDVSDDEDPEDSTPTTSSFASSKWFTRGWTLQELVAPRYVVFLSSTWRTIGTKQTLAHVIEGITGIDSDVLMQTRPLGQVSIARRMSWAALRQTTREEDRAYSLMGIFGVHMPTIYGEGPNAFIRLQEEILKRSSDQTIFVWGKSFPGNPFSSRVDYLPDLSDAPHLPRALLASSPSAFATRGKTTPIPYKELSAQLGLRIEDLPEYRLTSDGVRTDVPLTVLTISAAGSPSDMRTVSLAILACRNEEGALASLFIRTQPQATGRYFVGVHAVERRGRFPLPSISSQHFRIVFLLPSILRSLMLTMGNVILYPFDHPASISPVSALPSPSQPTLHTYAFFFSHRTLGQLAAKGFLLDGAEDVRDDQDGYLLELPSASDATEMSISFSKQSPPNDQSPRAPYTTTITITAGSSCSCELGVIGDTASLHPAWIAIAVRCRWKDVDAAHSSTVRLNRIRCRPLLPAFAVTVPHVHLPVSPAFTLDFGDDGAGLCRVELDFRIWEDCHRSTATHVYMLNLQNFVMITSS